MKPKEDKSLSAADKARNKALKEDHKNVADAEARKEAAAIVGKMSAEKTMTEDEEATAMAEHFIKIRNKLMLKHLQTRWPPRRPCEQAASRTRWAIR